MLATLVLGTLVGEYITFLDVVELSSIKVTTQLVHQWLICLAIDHASDSLYSMAI